ncbi:restriction endonuclease subunit S [Thermoactinomyces sp. CICC 10522]|uniref:restriction endonuclease subunit S n=1 Tax=Thermoactinomyces sp. CICC 10522 TaxID=2767427 RepID=UPI0018DCE048|nr:restriction endonuclease subunit S [Thermoactinomyces sp. CICC 10522]MBH8605829.1 restriction endonuclease subunit S [Thermoactinomyces sp. CICC 10522]
MSFEEWKEVRLGDIAHVQTGPFGSQLHQRDYKECGTPIITVEHLGDNRIIHANTPFVSDEDKERLKKYILHQGDIVFSRVGSVDRRALVRKREEGWLFSGRCLRVRVTDPEIDSEYLSYYFGLESFKEYVRRIAVGATMPSLNTKILSNIKVRIPDFVTQKNIVKMLSPFDEKIELNNQINKNLEEMAQAIFKSWFVDFEPFQNGEFVESELGLIPKRWEVKQIGDVCTVVGGGTPKTKVAEYWEGGDILWATPSDMTSKDSPVIYDTSRKITREGLSNSAAKLVPSGSVIMTSRATIGYSAITMKELCTNQGFINVVCDENISSYYMLFYLKYSKDKIKGLANGSTFLEISRKVFKEIGIVVPPKHILEKFNEIVEPIIQSIYQSEIEIQKLTELRDTLLPKLMSGEIRVPLENEGRHQDEQLQRV